MKNYSAWTESYITPDGQSYITIQTEEPTIDERGLYRGGKFVRFELDHKKNNTRASIIFKFVNGVPTWQESLSKSWHDEILTTAECLEYCKANNL